MTIRSASEADLPALRELWEAFEAEFPEPLRGFVPLDEEWAEVPPYLESGLAIIAESDGRPVGFALARMESPSICYLSDLYVRPEARWLGVAKALMARVSEWGGEKGAKVVTLDVLTTNDLARSFYDRLGFHEEARALFAPVTELSARLVEQVRGASHGAVHVQTDDVDAVARAVRQFVPRLPGGSQGSVVMPPQHGWTTVYDELCDRDPAMLRRLALELSDRMGAVVLMLGVEEGVAIHYVLFERGSVVDEYLSVPEYHGPLPPGDVIALAANPTVVARLTGADPARVREVAKTGGHVSELPPTEELLADLAAVLGVQGSEHTYTRARELPGAILLDRA